MTSAVGLPVATSSANVGPDITATCADEPITFWITSDIRSSVPASRPFVQLTRVVPSARCGLIALYTSRTECDGIALSTTAASPRTSAIDVDADTFGGNGTCG